MIELLQQRVWSLERELEGKCGRFQMLEVLLLECQQKEKEHLEFRKSLGEEQMTKAQRAVRLAIYVYANAGILYLMDQDISVILCLLVLYEGPTPSLIQTKSEVQEQLGPVMTWFSLHLSGVHTFICPPIHPPPTHPSGCLHFLTYLLCVP